MELYTRTIQPHLNEYLFIYLFIWLPVKNMQKWYIIIIIIIFEHGINFGWREQVETTSTMPVNHISELKL